MVSRYRLLPENADHIAIARICRECIRQMRREKVQYKEIVERISQYAKSENGSHSVLSLASLKTFMNRDSVKRLNNNNITIELIYNYIFGRIHDLSDEIKAIVMPEWGLFSPTSNSLEALKRTEDHDLIHALSALLGKWMYVNQSEMVRIHNKISGRYIMLRRSIHDHDEIIRSTVIIGDNFPTNFISATHIHTDRANVIRISRGFLTPVVRNIYSIMDIENGEGIDILALKEPVQQKFVTIFGFNISINIDRKLISARIFLERENDLWASAPHRFKISDLSDRPKLQHLVEKRVQLLDIVKSQTLPDISVSNLDDGAQ